MSMNDPLGDLLTRIRNAQMRNKSKVSSPGSKLRESARPRMPYGASRRVGKRWSSRSRC